MAYRDATIPAPAVWGKERPALARRGVVAEFAALAFFFIVYANLAVVAARFHNVPQVVASSVVLLLLVPLARNVALKRQPLAITPVLPLVFAFMGALFLAAALSSEPQVAGRFVVTYLTEGLLLYLLVSNAVREVRTLSRVVWVLILAGSFMGAISIYQEFTHTYTNDYGGLAQVDKVDSSGGGFNVGGDEEEDEEVLRPRLGGPLGSENRYAQILAVVLPLALIKVFREPSRRLRLVAAVSSLLITGGLMLTFSRGAAVAVALTLLVMVLLRELRIRHVLALLAAATVGVALAVPDYIIRLSSLESVTAFRSDPAEVSDSAILGRGTENLAAWYTFVDHPFTGVGPGVYFREYSREYANRLGLRHIESERRGHSLYLELAADTGALGLGAFLAMVGTALALLFRSSWYWRSRDPERARLASAFFFALFAYLATGAFLHLSYQRYFWMLLALATSAIWVLRQDQRAQELESAAQPSLRGNAA